VKNAFQIVSNIFRTPALMLLGAQACANVYQKSQGLSDVTFDHNSPDFKLYVPGVIAADTAANIIASDRNGIDVDGNVAEAAYVAALEAIANDDLNPGELHSASNVANATWRTSQYGDQEDRWSSEVNRSFNLLPLDEKFKDIEQLKAAAAFLLQQINSATE
jgi:hypothetical protein